MNLETLQLTTTILLPLQPQCPFRRANSVKFP